MLTAPVLSLMDGRLAKRGHAGNGLARLRRAADPLLGPVDEDFGQAAQEQPAAQARPALDFLK